MAAFAGDPAEIVGVGLCTIRCCKTFLRADGSLVEPVISWMDDRAYQPYVPDDPDAARTPPRRRATSRTASPASSRTRPPTTSCCSGRSTPTRGSGATTPALFEQFGVTREHAGRAADARRRDRAASRPRRRRRPASRPACPWSQTANDKAVEMLGAGSLGETTALVSLGTYIAAMVHGHENHADAGQLLDQLRLHPAPLPVREQRRAPRDVDAHLVPRPARRRGGRACRVARACPASSTSNARPAQVPAGSDGLMTVLDWLATTDKPFRKGMMLGFDARHTRGHVYRSILEAIALTMKHHVDAMCAELGHHARRDRRLRRRLEQPAVHADLRRRVRHPGVTHRRRRRGQPRRGDLRRRGRRACIPTSRPPPRR